MMKTKNMNKKKEDYLTTVTKGEQYKQQIYDSLKESPKSRRVCTEAVGITKCQFSHYINFLLKNGHVKRSKGMCPVYESKVDILRVNPDYPFVASTIEEIEQKRQEQLAREEIIKKHVRVIKNFDKPMRDDAWVNRRNRITMPRTSSSLDFI